VIVLAEQISLTEDGGEIGSNLWSLQGPRLQKEQSKAWMGTKPSQLLPGVRGASVWIQRSKRKQLPLAFLKRGSRRGFDPRQGFA